MTDRTGDADGERYHDVWETRVRFEETDAQGVVFEGKDGFLLADSHGKETIQSPGYTGSGGEV